MNRDQYFELQKRIIPAYIRVEQLPDEVKQRHKIKVGAKVPRYDGMAMYGNCKPFWELMNNKGQLVLYLNETHRNRLENTDGNPASRQADRYLQGKGSINVSSIYLTEYTTADGRRVGYGNPDPSPTYGKDRKPNPFKYWLKRNWRAAGTGGRNKMEQSMFSPASLNQRLLPCPRPAS